MTGAAGQSLDGDQLAGLLLRLLLDGGLRERLASEGAARVAASAAELECLETVDPGELDVAARRFRSGIWRLGRNGLGSAFRRSLQMLAAAGIDEAELLTGYLGSRHFASFRLIPYTGRGQSVEESFASFLLEVAETSVQRETVTHELMIALFTALVCEQPLSFVISTQGIVRTGTGHAALRSYSPASLAAWREGEAGADTSPSVRYAYFATAAGVARGVVSDLVAAAFEATPTAEGDAARWQLSRRGLW